MTDKTYEAERDEAADSGEWLGGSHGRYLNKAWKEGADWCNERAKSEIDKQLTEARAEIERLQLEVVKRNQYKINQTALDNVHAHYEEAHSLIDEMAEAIENECSSGCGVKMTEALAKYEAWKQKGGAG